MSRASGARTLATRPWSERIFSSSAGAVLPTLPEAQLAMTSIVLIRDIAPKCAILAGARQRALAFAAAPASRKDCPAWLAASRTCGSAWVTAALRFWSATLPPPEKEPLIAASASSTTPQMAAMNKTVMKTGWRRRLARSSLRPRS